MLLAHNSWCKYIFIWMCQSTAPECTLCVCVCVYVCVRVGVCVRVISNQSTSKKRHHVSDLSKLDALIHKTRIKALRRDMCTPMISLSKVAYRVWCDHPFRQRNKTAE